MSNNLKKYITIDGIGSDASDLNVTAFIGGKYGNAIQFTIGNKYVCLSQKQLIDLMSLICKRINNVEGFSATDEDLEDEMKP